MFMAMAQDIRVILIKVSDRLHNMRTMEYQSPMKQREKSLETMEIYAPIAHRLGMQKMKWELEDLSLRYLDPVEKGCRHYLGVLGGAENLRFAADGTPVYEAFGAYRPLGYYSVGSKELVGLCTRVALADAIFQKQPPVLIFDDPFVNLDDEKTERAKALVKELSKRYQIIYLTCKSERKI